MVAGPRGADLPPPFAGGARAGNGATADWTEGVRFALGWDEPTIPSVQFIVCALSSMARYLESQIGLYPIALIDVVYLRPAL